MYGNPEGVILTLCVDVRVHETRRLDCAVSSLVYGNTSKCIYTFLILSANISLP